MPWALEMVSYCYDPWSGGLIQWPMPDMTLTDNHFAITAMRVARYMTHLHNTPEDDWTFQDKKFYMDIHKTG